MQFLTSAPNFRGGSADPPDPAFPSPRLFVTHNAKQKATDRRCTIHRLILEREKAETRRGDFACSRQSDYEGSLRCSSQANTIRIIIIIIIITTVQRFNARHTPHDIDITSGQPGRK